MYCGPVNTLLSKGEDQCGSKFAKDKSTKTLPVVFGHQCTDTLWPS
jgi:hypothetical protein